MRFSIGFDRRRIAGAARFALVCTMLIGIGQLLDRNVDVAGLAGSYLAGCILGYVAWPWLSDVWEARDKREDRKRFLMMGLGVAAGFALTRVIPVVVGADEARSSLGLWFVSVAAIVVLAMRVLRRARGT